MPFPKDIVITALELQTLNAILQIIGVIGSITYIVGFLLLQSGRICGNGLFYPLSKFFAACCVLASLTTAFNFASFLIQISFMAIALYGVWLRVTGRITARLDRSAAAQTSGTLHSAPHIKPATADARSPALALLQTSPGDLRGHQGDPDSSDGPHREMIRVSRQ